ncbi:MAG TPA: calcium/sodium antiporter [Gammaproteobacteria bacterium]|nr:calcium/sodium antiporter [Gammaproteobacteria bacterium]HIL98675.1 calcium/sodium antiporter [Pseudomonadales bacterium]
MLIYSVLLLVGFLVLFKSADQFVIGSIATAKNLNISPMVIGLTVVALGTSAPEIFVAVAASLRGEPELAIGNAIGSNIANLGMVLGVTAILVPLPFRPEVLKNDLPIMFFVTLCAGVALVDLQLTIIDGLLLASGLVMFLVRVGMHSRNRDEDEVIEVEELQDIPDMPMNRAALNLVLSLVFLLLSAELLVYSVVAIAKYMGVSEMIIGLTVIAIGTSLPELVVSVTSALKGQTDLAIGNILGSNIFNLLAVLAIPCILSPIEFSPELLWRDYGLMLGMTLIVSLFAYGVLNEPHISRLEGLLLLLVWFGYLTSLYYSTQPA